MMSIKLGIDDISKMFLGSTEIVKAYLGEDLVFSSDEPVTLITLFSWGNNANGRTGLNTSSGNTTTPTQVGTDTDWSFIQRFNTSGADFDHNVIIKDNYSIWGFGRPLALGDGLTSNQLTPVQLGTDTDWVQTAGGFDFTIARKSNGTIYGAGTNANGRTGQDTTVGSTEFFTQIGTSTNWVYIAGGSSHGMAIDSDGKLYTWGPNSNGRTGLDTTTGNTLIPTQVGTDTDWKSIDGGSGFSSGIKTNGTLWSFGSNSNGRTGLGTTSGNQTTPLQVGTDTDWHKIAVGQQHCLALKTNGTLWTWGDNADGRTGLNTSSGNTTTPTQIGTADNWVYISAGRLHSTAIDSDGKLYTWGSNSNGRTGLDTTTGNTLTPTQVGTDTDWIVAKAGSSHSLGLKRT